MSNSLSSDLLLRKTVTLCRNGWIASKCRLKTSSGKRACLSRTVGDPSKVLPFDQA